MSQASPPGQPRNAPGSPALDQAMERYAQGEDRAFSALHAGLAPRVRLYLRRLTGRDDLAEDLCQETMLRIHRARSSFVPGAAVVPWAYAIARNCHIDYLRARRARIKLASPVTDEGESVVPEVAAAGDSDAEAVHVARETAALIERELQRMTLARREAFVLLRYEGLSVAEAAAVLGATESAVKLRAFHAYEAIRKALAASEPAAPDGGSP